MSRNLIYWNLRESPWHSKRKDRGSFLPGMGGFSPRTPHNSTRRAREITPSLTCPSRMRLPIWAASSSTPTPKIADLLLNPASPTPPSAGPAPPTKLPLTDQKISSLEMKIWRATLLPRIILFWNSQNYPRWPALKRESPISNPNFTPASSLASQASSPKKSPPESASISAVIIF